ncbi:fungal-specific transcription factor domain-containing protein [Nemania abortiva]|nr:fungal-specific transcription factor domain-containing protein [Nemania abortiva]
METVTSSGTTAAKKTRGKYTSKAWYCSGTQPCQRCSRRGTRCAFPNVPLPSERPEQQEAQSTLSPSVATSPNANGDSGHSVMETRMKTIESTIRTLMELIPQSSVRANHELPQLDEESGFQGDTAFQAPVNAFNVQLASLREQLTRPTSSPSSHQERDGGHTNRDSTPTVTDQGADSLKVICLGGKSLPFPAQAQYSRYLDFIFKDINASHPCLNQGDFRSRSDKLTSTRILESSDACFLATNYILFACTDILTDVSLVQNQTRLPGWQWYLAADEIMCRRKLSGRDGLDLLQFLVFEALYLTYSEKLNTAYNVSGLACRLCFQLGLHQQKLWGANCSPFSQHMRRRIFWTVYFADRRISSSCGRPYGIRDSDVDVDEPQWVDDEALHPDRPIPMPDPDKSFIAYLSCMVAWSRFAGEVWDQVFSTAAPDNNTLGEKITVLDARIMYWMDTKFREMPLLATQDLPTKRQLEQQSTVITRMNHLRLLLRRRTMVSLSYSSSDGRLCGELAMDIVKEMQARMTTTEMTSTFRLYISTALGGAVLILATLLARYLTAIDLHIYRSAYTDSYRQGISMLRELAVYLISASNILRNLRNIVSVVDLILEKEGQASQNGDFSNIMPDNMDDVFSYGFMDSDLNLIDEIPLEPYIASESIVSWDGFSARNAGSSTTWD